MKTWDEINIDDDGFGGYMAIGDDIRIVNGDIYIRVGTGEYWESMDERIERIVEDKIKRFVKNEACTDEIVPRRPL